MSIKLPAAINELNEIITIKDAVKKSGKFYCGCCKKEVILRHGEIKAKHFSHKNQNSCAFGYETALHLLAKKILERNNGILVPYLGKLNYYNPQIEKVDSGLKPDILIDTEYGKIHIEIFVTHKCSPSKIEKLKSEEIPLLEISLNFFKKELISEAELENLLIKEISFKRWLVNPPAPLKLTIQQTKEINWTPYIVGGAALISYILYRVIKRKKRENSRSRKIKMKKLKRKYFWKPAEVF